MMRARRYRHLITISVATTCYWCAVTYALTPTPHLTSAEWESRLCQGYGVINAAFGDNWGRAEWASDFSKLAVMVYYPTNGPGPPNSNTEIFVFHVGEAGAPVNVTAYPGPDRNPAWSPDGRQLAFTRDFSDKIQLIDQDGKNLVELTGNGSELAWSPTGAEIAFIDSTLNLSVVSTKGSRPQKLTLTSDHAAKPAWSPDGHQIAFIRAGGSNDRGDLLIVNADGTNQVIVNPASASARTLPLWSPDGSTIAFGGWDASRVRQIFLVRPDGLETRQLTHDPLSKVAVTWSPDGSEIAYITKNTSGLGELDVLDVKAGSVKHLCSVAY